MTDARCEPPPELRGRDGWHWVVWTPTGETEPYNPVAIWWDAEALGWCPDLPKCADTRELTEYRYLAPALTPAEVAALRAERDAAWNEVEREREKYKDDMHAAIVEVGRWSQRSGLQDAELTTLRAEVERLKSALEPLAAVAAETWETAPDGSYLEDIGMGSAITLGMCRIARAALEPQP